MWDRTLWIGLSHAVIHQTFSYGALMRIQHTHTNKNVSACHNFTGTGSFPGKMLIPFDRYIVDRAIFLPLEAFRQRNFVADSGGVSRSWCEGQGQGHRNVTNYTHSRMVCLRLKSNLVSVLVEFYWNPSFYSV